MSLPEQIAQDLPFLTSLRHNLHAHPELGFEEERTSGIVATLLEEAGITVHRGLGKTGVVGTLQVGNGTRRIGLRADMDALAMPEKAERPYKSTFPARCMPAAMTATRPCCSAPPGIWPRRAAFPARCISSSSRPRKAAAAPGAWSRRDSSICFPCDAVYGLHNMPGLDVDEMAVVEGPQLASSDSWRITFRGTGTHGAKPHLGKDPITAAATFLSSLQTIVGRVVDPLQPAVVSACSLQAGDPQALNVIPDTVDIGGTARAYSPEVRDQLEQEIGRLAHGTAAMYGIAVDYQFERRIPPVVNDRRCDRAGAEGGRRPSSARRCSPAFRPRRPATISPSSARRLPGCYVWLGNGPAVDGALHHNTAYDFNDDAIGSGVAFWTTLVEQELGVE